MKKILYTICIALCAAALAGCAKNNGEAPENPDGEMVAIELSGTFEPAEVTRADAYVSQDISNVLFVIFDAAGNFEEVRTIGNYDVGERLYLRVGRTYKIFAIANIADSNCPNGDMATYFSVSNVAELSGKYLVGTSIAPSRVIMCSDAVAELNITSGAPYSHTLPVRCVQTRIDLNIYNKVSGPDGNTVTSGVTLFSYHINSLPRYSYMLERPADYSPATYWDTADTNFPAYTVAQSGATWYRKYSIVLYTFENRQGSGTTPITNVNDRKKYAPELATEIVILGADADGYMFETYVFPGKGTASVTDINNFDIDRNCVYHVDVVINSTNGISIDSRRQYYKTVLCGNLEDPTNGTGADF